jgi:hypothetical protein
LGCFISECPTTAFLTGFGLVVSRGQLDDTHFVSATGQFYRAPGIELFHEIGPMGFDRLDAYFKFFGNLLGTKAFSYRLEDFSLAIGKSALLFA